MWQPSEEDIRNCQRTREFLAARGIHPGHRFKDKRDGPCVFSRIGATGKMVCHPEGEPDMQSSWVWSPEDFAKHVLNETT